VDVGEPIPNVNDGFSGAAPDLGAYELGSGLVPYGPRTGEPVCGNGVVEEGEDCDDSNTTGGDGCDAECRLESVVQHDGGVTGDAGVVRGGDDAGAASGRDASVPGVDGGVAGGADGSTEPTDSLSGCACSASRGGGSRAPLALLVSIAALLARRRARARR